MKRVLLVEDDRDIVNLLKIHLHDLDFEVEVAFDGLEGEKKALEENFDLVILDVMLPFKDGNAIAQKMRAYDNHTPILMLTARTEEIDKVLGLESGADDYLTKPFGIREFIARVKALMRRHEMNVISNDKTKGGKLVQGDLHIDLDKRKVLLRDKRIDLTPKEFDLLVLLVSNPGRSYSREQLLKEVWGYEFSGYEHTVNSHINRLRAKIEPEDADPHYILTSWGIGYRFNDEIKKA